MFTFASLSQLSPAAGIHNGPPPMIPPPSTNLIAAVLRPRPALTRFLLFSPYGQHNNQLLTLFRALNLAHRSGRALVIPPFARHKGREVFSVASLYDFRRFARESPFEVHFQESFRGFPASSGVRAEGTRPAEVLCVVPFAAARPKANENLVWQ